MRLLVLLLGLFVTSKAWELVTNYKDVEIGTTSNVYLVCRFDAASEDTSGTKSLLRIRIYKIDAEGKQRTVEKIGVDEKSPKTEGREVMSSFDPADISGSFLNVTWPIATEETPGQYGCDVLAYNSLNTPVIKETPRVTIEERSITLQDLLQMIEEVKSDFQVKEKVLQKRIKSLENQLNDTQDAYVKADQEIMDSMAQTAMQLRNESLVAHSLIRREMNDTRTKYQEADVQLRKEIAESKDLNANKLRIQATTIAHLQRGILELQNETKELNENRVNDVLDLREEVSKEIMQLKDTYNTTCQQEISELRRETEEADARLKEETNQQMKANFTHLQDEMADLKRANGVLGEKLQNETLERKRQDQFLEGKFEEEMADLKTITTYEISEQFRKFDGELDQKINDSNVLNLEQYMKLDGAISEMRNKIQDGEDRFEKKLSDLRSFAGELISNSSTDCCNDLQESISYVKNYTTNEVNSINDELKESIKDIKNGIGTDIEEKIRELNEALQDGLSDLRNSTSIQIEKYEGTRKTMQKNFLHLRQMVENKYVNKITLKELLSNVYNFTTAEISKNKEDILELKNSTTEELRAFDDRLSKAIPELNGVISNISNECETKIVDLWLNTTELNTQIANRIISIESYNLHRKNDVDNSFQYILRLVESVNITYENITSTLREDLVSKSQCVCPTPQLPNLSTEDNTSPSISTTAVRLESTTSQTTQLPMETTNTSTAPLTSTSTIVTETTMPNVYEWPEGTYALITPESGCPDNHEFTWEEGWMQFHTSTEFNNDLVSRGNHFKKPIFRHDSVDNFVQLHYCLKKQRVSNARLWPIGSYCINRVNGQCPTGFRSGYIQYDEENTHIQQKHQNAPDIFYKSGELKRVYYCCRKDGSPDEAMHMPTNKPLYLYRVNDAPCQEISGMKVSQEILQIDTNHDDNEDAFEDTNLHPYASLHPVRHVMCYYTLSTVV